MSNAVSICTRSVVGSTILHEIPLDDIGLCLLKDAGISAKVLASYVKTVDVMYLNKLYHGIGMRNASGGMEFFSPQLTPSTYRSRTVYVDYLKAVLEEGKSYKRASNVVSRKRKRKKCSMKYHIKIAEHLNKAYRIKCLRFLYGEVIYYTSPSYTLPLVVNTITIGDFNVICCPFNEFVRSRSCCLFTDLMDYLAFKTLLYKGGLHLPSDSDCLIMNSLNNFVNMMIDSDLYERVYCFFPCDEVSKTMEKTLISRRADSVKTFSFYQHYLRLFDYNKHYYGKENRA